MAVTLLADWAMFDPSGPQLHRVEIDLLPENERSRKVALKVGASYEGMRKAYMFVNGQWRDHESYALLPAYAHVRHAGACTPENVGMSPILMSYGL